MLRNIFLGVLLVLVVMMSCSDSVNLPPVKGPPLKVPEGAGSPAMTVAKKEPLKVIHYSPRGQLTSPHLQITVSFNKPMVALEKVEDQMKKSPLVFKPAVKGARQRWLGTRTLVLEPSKPLAGSTEYTATIPAGIKALDGTALAKGTTWKFTTPRLKVVRVRPYRGSRWLRADTRVELFFNQPVDPARVEQFLEVKATPLARPKVKRPAKKSGKVKRDIKRPTRARPATVVSTPVKARVMVGRDRQHMVVHANLPLASRIAFAVKKGLTGQEGPLPMTHRFYTYFTTYGPFRVTGLSCVKDCDPESSVTLRFSNPVQQNKVRAVIRVNNAKLNVGRSKYASAYVYIDRKLGARKRYTVTIRGKLEDRFGQPLVGPRRFTFATGDYDPYVQLPLSSGVLEDRGHMKLPLYFRNASKATLRSKALDPAGVAALLGHKDYWDDDKTLLDDLAGVKTAKLKVAVRPNRRVTRRTDLKKLLGKPRGLLAMELETTLKGRGGTDHSIQRSLVRVTDLAMTAKHSPRASLIWVTSLASGKPVAGAEVSIWRLRGTRPVWSGTTDKSGLAMAPGADQLSGGREHKLLFFAQKGGDQNFVDSTSRSGINAWDFGMDEAWDDKRGSLMGLMFSDRGLYRPGDTVHVKGIVRKREGGALKNPVGMGLSVTATDSRGEKIVVKKLRLSEFGTFSMDVKVPAGAPLGSYSVTAKPDGESRTIYGSFRVEEYRVAEFKVSTKADRRHLVRGEQMGWATNGAYLFGSPMRGAKVNWSMYWSPSYFSPPRHEGYVFSDRVWYWGTGSRYRSGGHAGSGNARLDQKGQHSGKKKLAPAKMIGPRSYELEATVTDISRQTISSRATVLLHPGEFYVGGKPEETFLKAGDKLKTSVLAVAHDGKRVPRVAITGTLYRREWHSVRKQGMGGSHYFISRPVEKKVGGCKVRSAAKPRPCDVEVPKAGYYVLRLQARDRRGNKLMSSFGVYASGPDYVAWRRDAEDRVELVKDRKVYKVGQVARILVKSPYAKAHGLMTVERDGIHTQQPFKLKRTSRWIRVPITRELSPNAFVSVILVRGRMPAPKKKKGKQTYQEEDPGKPAFKVGYVKLVVSQADRRLKVAVKPQKPDYRPGQEATVDLTVRDHRGKPVKAELTVVAADEGVLSLIGYKMPDPMPVFYSPMGLSVRTADNRLNLLSRRVFGEKGKSPGGGGGEAGAAANGGMRRKFVSTPYYNPSVVTDDKGKARVTFKLPDNLTTFRLMAMAVSSDSRFGKARGQVKVNKPLLMLPTLPRFVRVGDRIEAGVVVHNNLKTGGTLEVKAEASGVELIGARSSKLQIKGDGSVEARFAFQAKKPGEATFRFTAALENHRDGLELKRQVKLPLVMETVATYGSTESASAEGVVPSGGVRTDVGGLDVAMSSSALVGLRGGMEYLLDYPYECLEQTTSRMVPLVLLKELNEAFGLEHDKKQSAALVAKLIGRVARMQRWDGGFSYWPSSSHSYPWVSAYAAWGLGRASEHGHKVSDRVLKQARSYLNKQLRQKERKDSRSQDLTTKAYMVYVLTTLGEQPTGYVSRLFEHRKDLTIFGKALLLSATTRLKQPNKEMIRVLTDDVANQVHQTARVAKVEENLGDGYAPMFHSDTRSTAMVLDALLAADQNNPLVEKLVRYLVSARKNGRWSNTQETVYALMAMYRYYEVREKVVPDFVAKVFLGEDKLLQEQFKGRSLKAFSQSVPMARLRADEKAGTLGFVKQGKGRLYYSASLRYARTTLPKKPLDAGFYVTRTYQPVSRDATSRADLQGSGDGKAKGVTKVKAGDLVRVTLSIVVPQQMHFVAVDDPLPAGLEATNFKLMTAARHSGRHLSYGRRSRYSGRRHGSAWYTPFYQQQIRDDRVQLFADSVSPGIYTYVYLARATTVGTYVAPPTHVEQMYEPEVFGRTGAVTFEVTK